MANLIPAPDFIYDYSRAFRIIQQSAKNLRNEAIRLKTNITAVPVGVLNNFYAQCVAKSAEFAKFVGDVGLNNYANTLHPDANYDLDAALTTAVAAYDAFVTAYDQFASGPNVGDQFTLSSATINMTPVVNKLDGIIATVQTS